MQEAVTGSSHTQVWLKIYRSVVMLLLSIVSVVVLRMYNMIAADHDLNINQQSKIDELQKLPPKVEQLDKNMVYIKTKLGYNVEKP